MTVPVFSAMVHAHEPCSYHKRYGKGAQETAITNPYSNQQKPGLREER